jgi:hypothetical protein
VSEQVGVGREVKNIRFLDLLFQTKRIGFKENDLFAMHIWQHVEGAYSHTLALNLDMYNITLDLVLLHDL